MIQSPPKLAFEAERLGAGLLLGYFRVYRDNKVGRKTAR
jgi:hypothetical protein